MSRVTWATDDDAWPGPGSGPKHLLVANRPDDYILIYKCAMLQLPPAHYVQLVSMTITILGILPHWHQ
jgi:hypothetical protein